MSNLQLVPLPEAANVRDLSNHSTRGDSVSNRRRRKAPKPLWLTVLRIFRKNFVHLVLLVGLIEMVTRLGLRYCEEASPFAVSDLEGRISKVEKLVENTAKTKSEVEALDRKIDSQVGGLRKEVGTKIEEKSGFFERQLKELEVKHEGLEKLFGEFKDENRMLKEDFEKIYQELRKARSHEIGSEMEMNLNDIRAYVRDLMFKEIEKHAADGLSRVDYALAATGGMVVKHSEPLTKAKGQRVNWFRRSPRNKVHHEAEKMLKSSFGEPGQCFPLKGSSGFVEIRLKTAIIPEAITLEHVAKSVAFDKSSAPKNCKISGWLRGWNTEAKYYPPNKFLLAEFTYDLVKSNALTYDVLDSASSNLVDTITIDFTSNHGNPSYTCIYRLRVHGQEPESIFRKAMQS